MNARSSFILIVISIVALFAAPLAAETAVWRVAKNGHYLYLGGTLHLLSRSDYPLPMEFDQAYDEAEIVAFEIDLGALEKSPAQTQAMVAMMYQDDRTLNSVLSPAVYAELDNYLTANGLDIAVMDSITAGGVSMIITILELQKMGLTESGVDKHYYQKAAINDKPALFLETVEQQLAFITGLGEGMEDDMVSYTLRDIERLSVLMNDLKAQWEAGDMEALDQSMLAMMRREFPDAYKALMVDRNNAWMPQLEAMMKTSEVEFVLVGAAHLAGKDGLLELLKAKGYRIEQL